MLTRITLDNRQIAHGHNLTEALEQLTHCIHPRTVKALFEGETEKRDESGIWRIEQEPAFDAGMVRAACEAGEGFVTVTMDMEGRFSHVG